jgi:alpha-L-fucosidase 2
MIRAASILAILLLTLCGSVSSQLSTAHNLVFDSLAKRWDEGIPLGNGWLGVLIWQKEEKLRLSLDRVDLWDDRPMPEIDKIKFKWIAEMVEARHYDTVQKLGDEPYEKYAAPTRIPAAALEFDLNGLGKVESNVLDISNGLSTIKFSNGVVFNNYVHATNPVGYFGFEGVTSPKPVLKIPNYNSGSPGKLNNSVEGSSLERLGYAKGIVTTTGNSIRYHQPTWNNHYYEVLVKWYAPGGNRIIGQWTITQDKPAMLKDPDFKMKEPTGWPTHASWWQDYWNRSAIDIPDSLLEKQYYLEMYKFACVARSNTPPISLQGIWTADNGNLPPWKGDFHHDLNTQLSYWPGYASNHLDLTAGYTNWLWKVKDENKRWTKDCFEIDGLNVPGVTTISGKPMGGWIQYSMSPTTVAWICQHFYWQWRYSMDRQFLETRAKPYILDAANFLDKLTKGETKRHLILSSSPEYNNNSIGAWFSEFTNYDLALTKALFEFAGTVNFFSGNEKSGKHWLSAKRELPEWTVNETGLAVAPGQNLDESHRHHSPYMAIYPLCLLNVDDSTGEIIIERSLKHIGEKGTRQWCGYSFSWMACIYARARMGEKAAEQLRIFANNFCSSNSFHLNGDQKGGQYSSFTYRPFTLEGNFAFAQGIHEMLLQTRGQTIELFPAVPSNWKNISFKTLRTEGAFLIIAKMTGGVVDEIVIRSEQGGKLQLKSPFKTFFITNLQKKYALEHGEFVIQMKKGEVITIRNGYE